MGEAVVNATYQAPASYDGATGTSTAGATTNVRAVFVTEASDPTAPTEAGDDTAVVIPLADLGEVQEGAALTADGRRYKLTRPKRDAVRVLWRVKAKEVS
jgi:hypothetical protein